MSKGTKMSLIVKVNNLTQFDYAFFLSTKEYRFFLDSFKVSYFLK